MVVMFVSESAALSSASELTVVVDVIGRMKGKIGNGKGIEKLENDGVVTSGSGVTTGSVVVESGAGVPASSTVGVEVPSSANTAVGTSVAINASATSMLASLVKYLDIYMVN
jgi:hypothetical protein